MAIEERNGLEKLTAVAEIRRRPTVREATFSDYDQIAAVQSRNGLSPRSRRKWTALWEGNPVYEEDRGGWPIGWVLESEPGRIVGCIANVPSAYLWKGSLIRVAAQCDWAVDREYRSFSLVLMQRITNQPNIDLLLTTTVGTDAEPSHAAFQWCRVPAGRWDRAAFWITGHRGFLRSALVKKRVPLAGLASSLLSVPLSCRDGLLRLGERRTSRLRIERRAEFDESFDVFWEELKRGKRDVLLAVRSAAALRWHFRSFGKAVWIVTASSGERLTAYAIFARGDNQEIGLTRLRLVDFQALENVEEALEGILNWVFQRCRLEGIHMVEDVGCVLEGLGIPQSKALARLRAPYHRDLASWAYYYRAKHPDLSDALKNSSVWNPTSLDGDASL
ncbi:MAG TPA: hypothetical protein VNY05_21300 [Candidatus Acidoferrales bacterium]|nr:hypothetical protein [Candidatus Acidoferrales bacterium]